jgi:hypothetical protein
MFSPCCDEDSTTYQIADEGFIIIITTAVTYPGSAGAVRDEHDAGARGVHEQDRGGRAGRQPDHARTRRHGQHARTSRRSVHNQTYIHTTHALSPKG